MRRTIGFLIVVGLIYGCGVVCWRLWRRRRSVTAAGGAADVTGRIFNTVDDEARWENEGGAVLPQ